MMQNHGKISNFSSWDFNNVTICNIVLLLISKILSIVQCLFPREHDIMPYIQEVIF